MPPLRPGAVLAAVFVAMTSVPPAAVMPGPVGPLLRDVPPPLTLAHHHMAVSLTPPDMDVARLRAWLQSLPSDFLRVKGLVRTPDGDIRYGSRTDDPFEAPRIIRVQARDGMEPDVVFIGSGLRPEFLRASFGNAEPAPAFRLF